MCAFPERRFEALGIVVGLGHRLADYSGLLKNDLLLRVRCERLALLDPQEAQVLQHEAVAFIDHLLLHQLVDALPVIHAFAGRLAPGFFACWHHRHALTKLAVLVKSSADLRNQGLDRFGLVLAQQAHTEEDDVG
ncbi:hypothetical protein D9M71_476940 [compost metagenome]